MLPADSNGSSCSRLAVAAGSIFFTFWFFSSSPSTSFSSESPEALDVSLVWREAPNAWHQRLARIVNHRYSTFGELRRFALGAKRAGVSALMLVGIQETTSCPGPWYNGLQLCDHINGSYTRWRGGCWRSGVPCSRRSNLCD